MVQPGMDDLPFVTPARPEIQQRGASVLKLAEEFQRIAGGWRCLLDRLRLQPTIPFLKHLGLPLILSHRSRVLVSRRGRPPSRRGPGVVALVFGSGFCEIARSERSGSPSAPPCRYGLQT